MESTSCHKVYQQAAALTSSSLFNEALRVMSANDGLEPYAGRPLAVRDWAAEQIHATGDIAEVSLQAGEYHHESQSQFAPAM